MPNVPSTKLIYDSVSMIHPDGKLMGQTSARKAQWFISKNLAKWEVENKAFKLTFTPQGHGKSHLAYYQENQTNHCVVCGVTENLNSHHVFPRVFRRHMPLMYKSSNSYDVLPICMDCHEQYEESATQLKAVIVKEYLGIEKLESSSDEFKENVQTLRAREFIKSLNGKGYFYKRSKLIKPPQDVIDSYMEIASRPLHQCQSTNHWGKQVMDLILEKELEQVFVERWRQHFIDTMNPKFLPKFWVVDMTLEKTTKVRPDVKLNEQDLKLLIK